MLTLTGYDVAAVINKTVARKENASSEDFEFRKVKTR